MNPSVTTVAESPTHRHWLAYPLGLARRSPTFVVGLGIVVFFLLLAVLAPVIAPFNPTQSFSYEVLQAPSGRFFFGSDGNGMDVFSRVIHGSRYAFGIAIPAGLIMIGIGMPLGLLAGYKGGWLDEVLLRTLDVLRAFPTIILALAVVAYVSCQIFSGRGAFLQVGAMTGTIMVANVAMVIIPGQRKMVAAMSAGATPDPKYGRWGKQRSVHNTYLTLPVIFIMISPHYPMTWQHPLNWLILLVIGLAGALVRQYFVLRQQGRNALWLPAGAVAAMVASFFIVQSGKQDYAIAEVPPFAEVQAIVAARCATCHAAKPSFEGIAVAPKGVIMESPAQIRRWAASMRQQVQTEAMPPGNMTEITPEERAKLIAWVAAGAPLD